MNDYPWLQNHWQRLLRLQDRKKMPHALLIVGPQGVGKAQFVHLLEKFLLCQNTQSTQEPCYHCGACQWHQQNTHPDHRLIKEKATIDDIREINHYLSQSGHQTKARVITLLQADKLSIYVANALLKILEEPPPQTIFILVAEKKTILPTIKSRCLLLNFSLPSQQVALEWLSQQSDEQKTKLQKYYLLAGRSPLKALELLKAENDIEPLMHYFLEGKIDDKAWKFLLDKTQEGLSFFYYWLTEFIYYRLLKKREYFYEANQGMLQKLSTNISAQQGLLFLEKISEAIEILTLPGANKQLIVESLFYQWQQLREKA